MIIALLSRSSGTNTSNHQPPIDLKLASTTVNRLWWSDLSRAGLTTGLGRAEAPGPTGWQGRAWQRKSAFSVNSPTCLYSWEERLIPWYKYKSNIWFLWCKEAIRPHVRIESSPRLEINWPKNDLSYLFVSPTSSTWQIVGKALRHSESLKVFCY